MTQEAPLDVAVVVGSTREGRSGDTVADWIAGVAAERAGLVVSVVDLAGYVFPARLPQHPTAPMIEFVGRLAAADAFVVVTPEYNRSFPAPLKQAIDYGYDEWQAKPVGFVSYGCQSEGLHAVEHLRSVFTELHAVTMRTVVGFNLLSGAFDRTGRPFDADRLCAAASTMLDQLTWWGLALREGRAARPYAS